MNDEKLIEIATSLHDDLIRIITARLKEFADSQDIEIFQGVLILVFPKIFGHLISPLISEGAVSRKEIKRMIDMAIIHEISEWEKFKEEKEKEC